MAWLSPSPHPKGQAHLCPWSLQAEGSSGLLTLRQNPGQILPALALVFLPMPRVPAGLAVLHQLHRTLPHTVWPSSWDRAKAWNV